MENKFTFLYLSHYTELYFLSKVKACVGILRGITYELNDCPIFHDTNYWLLRSRFSGEKTF